MVGRERERAMGGVLLFAEGAACRQGCSPIRSATGMSFAAPQQLTALGLSCATMLHITLGDHRPGKCIDVRQRSIIAVLQVAFTSGALFMDAQATDKGEEPDVMGRLRSGQQQSGQPESYAMCNRLDGRWTRTCCSSPFSPQGPRALLGAK